MDENPATHFEAAFKDGMADIADACVACGKCFEACPITGEAGLGGSDPESVTRGVVDILRSGAGPDEAETWSRSCILSGDCIAACDYGVNPRLMLSMARLAMKEARTGRRELRADGIRSFGVLSRGVKVLSQLQLAPEELRRLGQGVVSDDDAVDAEPPEFVFYTGCNVLKTPHMALLALDILDRLGVTYRVLGGTTHCCGIQHYRAGDIAGTERIATGAIQKLAATGATRVLAWCPSCMVQFSEVTLPTYERSQGAKPFDMSPFMLFLESRLDQLKPHLVRPINQRIALHLHHGVAGVVEAVRHILGEVPGLEIVDLGQPEMGLMSNFLRPLPDMQARLNLEELSAAEAAGVDALAAIYHTDHRDLCAHERDWPFAIINVLELIGASMGLVRTDHFKRLKMMQDVGAILEDCAEILARTGISLDEARPAIEQALLGDQPLALRGERGAS